MSENGPLVAEILHFEFLPGKKTRQGEAPSGRVEVFATGVELEMID